MRFDEKTDRYTLSTGRSFGAVEGAISPRGNGDLFQGFDGWLHEDIDTPLTDAERREIADYMIAAWRDWVGVAADVELRGSSEEFHGGMIAALAVVRVHDAETIWREIVATEKGVTETARKNVEDWEWGGFARYIGKR